MNYSILIPPIIGAGIGYITNWIAVKMMFRPIHPIKIGNFTLPFTPGIIPKNQSRLAESIGNSISNDLLTDEDFKQLLLSENIKEKIKAQTIEYLNKLSENNLTLEELILLYIENESYTKNKNTINSAITLNIYNSLLESNIGNIISEQIELAAKEKLKGSMLGFFGGNAIISAITSNVPEKVNQYLYNNGQTLISSMVTQEFDKYTSKSISDIATSIANTDIDFISIIMKIYEKFVTEKLSSLLETINISKMVTDKINSMNILELEKIILSIMKKELNALVNLGAIIGFILGLFNLLV